MPKKKHRIRKILLSAVLSLNLLAGCSSRLEPQKSIIPNFSPKTSVVETLNRFSMKAENATVYYDIYEEKLENRIEEKKDNFSYAKKRMIINSLLDYDSLSRDRGDFDAERYEEAENFIKDISGGAFRDAFRQFDFVVAFEEDFKSWFYNNKEDNKPGIKSNVKAYISKVTKASKIDLGASPFIRDGRFHFRTYARLENVLGFPHIKTEIGTNALELGLVKDLNENWTVLAKYKIEEYERKKSEIVFSFSRNYGENTRLTITAGWGEPLEEDNEKAQETYAGGNLTILF